MARKKYKYTPKDMHEKVYELLPFEGEWYEAIGMPECKGTWIIWGASFNGKSSFALQLAKYFCELGEKVAYMSLEMGDSKAMQVALDRVCMQGVGNKFSVWVEMGVTALREELKKQRSPKIVFVDSVQYLGINSRTFNALREEFPDKLFVFISHADKTGAPDGACAKKIMYEAQVKIKVEQFMAKCNSRYGGGRIYTIWEEGAQRMAVGNKFLTDNKEEKEDEQ